MRGHVLLPTLLLVLSSGTWAIDKEEQPPHDALEDDADEAVQRARDRIDAEGNTGAKLGILMVAPVKDRAITDLTVPIWKEYCRQHEMGFFLQEEPLLTSNLPFNWAKPRILLEILSLVKWKYVMLIEHNSLPKTMGKSWEYMIKQYMRYRRYANDKTDQRKIFCPWDCEEEYDNPFEDGACSGPALHGCILASKKAATRQLVQVWYAKRKNEDYPRDGTGIVRALADVQKRNHDFFFLKDVAEEVGKRPSKFLPVFTWDKAYGLNVRDQIYDFIKKDKKLSKIANEVDKRKEL